MGEKRTLEGTARQLSEGSEIMDPKFTLVDILEFESEMRYQIQLTGMTDEIMTKLDSPIGKAYQANMKRNHYTFDFNLSRVDRVVVVNAEINEEWGNANYAATMPGNFDAFLFAVLGGMF